MLRTHTCGELRKKNVRNKVKLCDWVDTIREYGKLAFIDLRDRYGKAQCVIIKRNSDFEKVIGIVFPAPSSAYPAAVTFTK